VHRILAAQALEIRTSIASSGSEYASSVGSIFTGAFISDGSSWLATRGASGM
jgi:hypothetical protein